MRRVLVICCLCMLLSGCCGNPVPPDVLAKIVAALTAAAALAGQRDKAGEAAFKHYVRVRAAYLGDKNPTWTSQANYTSLATRIGVELNLLYAVITEQQDKITDGDPTLPQHCDLQDAAKRLVTDGWTVVSRRILENPVLRKQRIAQIVWRAGAIQPELWIGTDDSLNPALKKAALVEVLDRRLRIVEMMVLHDQNAEIGKWTVAAVDSGWLDEQRTSMFQYPWVDLKNNGVKVFEPALAAKNLTLQALKQTFYLSPSGNRIMWRAKENRPRPTAAADWDVSDDPYKITWVKNGPASAAIERLIPSGTTTPKIFEDFWQRNWLYCDMTLAALHVEALRFALKRRNGNDAEFDESAGDGITLRPLIPRSGEASPSDLMDEGSDWFEGVAIPHDELQVGDHLVLWNSPFVRKLLHSPFGMENSLVTRIDADGIGLMLAGHGMSEHTEKDFMDELSKEIKGAFEEVRKGIIAQTDLDPGLNHVAVMQKEIFQYEVVRWAPYGEDFRPAPGATLTADGAWWVRILRTALKNENQIFAPNLDEALAMVPLSVKVDPAVHTKPGSSGDYSADDSVYLPLSVPKGQKGGWPAYFAKHAAKGETVYLDDIIPDGKMVLGFFAEGVKSPIPVFRPKLRT